MGDFKDIFATSDSTSDSTSESHSTENGYMKNPDYVPTSAIDFSQKSRHVPLEMIHPEPMQIPSLSKSRLETQILHTPQSRLETQSTKKKDDGFYIALGAGALVLVIIYFFIKNSKNKIGLKPLKPPRDLCGSRLQWSKTMKRRLNQYITGIKTKWSPNQVRCAVNNLENKHSYEEILSLIARSQITNQPIGEFITLSELCKPERMHHQAKCSGNDKNEYHNHSIIFSTLFQDDPSVLNNQKKKIFCINYIKTVVKKEGGFVSLLEKMAYNKNYTESLKSKIINLMN